MKTMERKNLGSPDETRTFPKGNIKVAGLDGHTFGFLTLEPGWVWAESVKPIAKTESCQVSHIQYVLSGKLRVKMDNGQELDFVKGDVAVVPPGHHAWVIGDEAYTAVEFTGSDEYAKPHKH